MYRKVLKTDVWAVKGWKKIWQIQVHLLPKIKCSLSLSLSLSLSYTRLFRLMIQPHNVLLNGSLFTSYDQRG